MIATLVEGQSETESLPVILRRFQESTSAFHVQVARPLRVKRNKVTKEGELEKSAKLVLRTRQPVKAILLVLDADDDCPRDLAGRLLERLQSVFPSGHCSVVVANRELEAWFLGSVESLKKAGLVRVGSTIPPDPEIVRGAKEMLSSLAVNSYSEVDDQPRFAAQFSFEEAAAHCRSFQKLEKEVRKMFGMLNAG